MTQGAVQPPQCVPHVAEAVAMNEMRRALIICIFDDMIELAFCRIALALKCAGEH